MKSSYSAWKKVYHDSFFSHFEKRLREELSLLVENVWSAPKSFLSLFCAEITKKNLILIAAEESGALFQDLHSLSVREPLYLPPLDCLPGEKNAPNVEIAGKRLTIFHHLLQCSTPQLLLTPLQTLLQRVPSPKKLARSVEVWKRGIDLPFELVPEMLLEFGYRREGVAAERGRFAVRGNLIDLFPPSTLEGYRVDFIGDKIDQIRTYNPSSQLSTGNVEMLTLLPIHETSLLDQGDERFTLLDYMGEHTMVLYDDLLSMEDQLVTLQTLYRSHPSSLLSFSDFVQKVSPLQQVYFSNTPLPRPPRARGDSGPISFELFHETLTTQPIPHPFHSLSPFLDPHPSPKTRLEAILNQTQKYKIDFLVESEGEKKFVQSHLNQIEEADRSLYTLHQGYLSSGFSLPRSQYLLLPFAELTRKRKVKSQSWHYNLPTPDFNFDELSRGDLVVHSHYGIGKYQKIQTQKTSSGKAEEHFVIEYAKKGVLFVPISQSHLIHRYVGAKTGQPSLNLLGSKKWEKVREQTQKSVMGYAHDLLQWQAKRELEGGFSYPPDSDRQIAFEEEFPFTLTEDQIKAIEAIKRDMETPKSMDRLICGDVGYGKTEVAMRAAFKAVTDGHKQVALLVPTTILAMQHYETFVKRMANFPIKVELLSRLVSKENLRIALKKAEKGEVDIIIGTHRLIGQDVRFADLGLVIIDEEQRFGVRAKEKLKKMKMGVDCLTLSATPIPRTLYLSLIGARDLSTINTPPHNRLPIQTVLAERNPHLIAAAITRELSRGGQAYFIHNRVESIYQVERELLALLPGLRTGVVHGQMDPGAIDARFHDFQQGRIDLLVATTIIENGVDIPNANTIFIDRADLYGMADLYQLRGRVGRKDRPSYAYLLTPKDRVLPEIAEKRLETLVQTSVFGGGMKLAMRDLELRGSGDFLGVQQSGNVSAIGFHLYCQLLKETISKMKREKTTSPIETRLEFHFNGYIPTSYIQEASLRMECYRHIGSAASAQELEKQFAYFVDRFGPLPPPLQWLKELHLLRIFAAQRQLSLIKFSPRLLLLQKKERKEVKEKRIPLPPLTDPTDLRQKIYDLILTF